MSRWYDLKQVVIKRSRQSHNLRSGFGSGTLFLILLLGLQGDILVALMLCGSRFGRMYRATMSQCRCVFQYCPISEFGGPENILILFFIENFQIPITW